MLKEFLTFIKKEKLLEGKEKTLLTVSGGMDSTVMCDLFHKAKLPFAIAHCNFNLRNEESDGDEQFVKTLAKKYKVPLYCKTFDTTNYAVIHKFSIQVAARELRYNWFKEIAKKGNYTRIATAHHLDDSIETFFINLLRGTGISGLQGIPVKQGNIIRPLLFANKQLLSEYAKNSKLAWREDSSNETDNYLRNNIRHNLIPSLEKLNVGFKKTMAKELSYLKDAAGIFKIFIEQKKEEILAKEGNKILLNIKKLQESGYAETVLYELLRAYDFTPETTALILKHLYSTAGKKFFSPTFRLIKDREVLILSPLKVKKEVLEYRLDKNQTECNYDDKKLSMKILSGTSINLKEKENTIAHIDYLKLVFPLRIRPWKLGDFFFPLGMTGKKKLSDFFIDKKLSINEKETVFVLESAGSIVWIIGYRIDDRYKITPSSKKILRLAVSY